MYDINEIALRLQNGYDVSPREKAYLVRNNPNALAAFMVDNNPGAVNMALRNLGYTHLGFKPDKKALARQLGIFIEQNNWQDFETVFKNFNLLSDNLDPEYLQELIYQFKQ